MSTPKNVIEVGSAEALQQALQQVKGPVALDFWSPECEPCMEEAPKVSALAEANPNLTVIKVQLDGLPDQASHDRAGALADAWKVDALPTLFFAKTGAELTPKKAQTLDDSVALGQVLADK